MEHLKHRTEAKVVAIINLILSGITLAVITIFSIYILSRVAALPPSSKDPADAIDDHTKVFVAVGSLVLIIAIGLEILELVSAIKLLKSTSPGTNFTEAANQARFWRNVAFVLLIMSIVGALTSGRSGGTGFSGFFYLLLRFFGILIVRNYIKELETAASQQACHVTYAVVGGGHGQGRVINAPPGSVVVVMDGQHHSQAGFMYPNLSQEEMGPPKYEDVVGKQ